MGNSKKLIKANQFHKHPFAVPFFTFLVLITISCGLFLIYGGQTVEGKDVKRVRAFFDGRSKTVPTRALTVGEFLERINVSLNPEDIVEPGVNSPISGDDFSINVYRAKPVTIIDEDGTKVTAKIAESSPEALAKKAGIKIYPEDKITYAAPDITANEGYVGDLVLIERAVPVVLNLYGKTISTRTQAETITDFLKEKNIFTQPGDKVSPKSDTKIKQGMIIYVLRKGQKIVSEEVPIPAPVETKYDATKEVGTTKVLDPGQDGVRIVTFQLEFKNGKEISRKEIQSIVALQPKTKVIVEGTKTKGFDGSFDAALARLRSCEGSYGSNTGNGYYGAYQYDIGTWGGYGGYPNAAAAPPAVQDQKAWETYQARGWSPWPACSSGLGLQDIYR